MSEQKYTWSEVGFSPVDNSKPRCQMNDRTLAEQIAALVKVMVDLSPNARGGYVVARNLMDKARVEVQYANRRAMQEVKAVKAVPR